VADNSLFSLQIDAHQSPPAGSPFTNFITAARSISKTLPDGNADDQVKAIAAIEQTIAGSATVAIDLQSDLDRYGVALAASSAVLVFVENVDDGTGTGVIEVRPHATTNPWTNLLGAGSAVKLALGSGMVVGAFKTTNLPVLGANRALQIVETSGQPTKLRVHLWLRK
jgi:transcriptional regulator of nitric oxide reductase